MIGSEPLPVRSLVPLPVAGGLAFKQMCGGEYRTCGLATDGRVYCSGLFYAQISG